MAVKSSLAKLFDKHKYELADLQRKSSAWFTGQVASMRDVTAVRPESLLRGDQDSKGTRIIPGHMYMYMYDPKYKDTLPYYDAFPLGLPYKQVPGGFYSLNLHYLPYNLRVLLLSRLMEFRTDSRMNEQTRLKFSWQLIDGISRFAAAKPCVKHYLYEHVKSPFKAIHIQDWATAILLPVEQFQNMTKQEVWKESTRIIRNS